MENLLNVVPDTVNSSPRQFTTHQFIIALAKEYQHAYIEALYEHLDSERPFQTFHSRIGKHLRQAETLVRFVREEGDADIFGQISDNTLWERIA